MQQKMLHKSFNSIRDIDTTEYSELVYQRKDKLIKYARLINEGCSEEVALSTLDLPRSTYFRWKKNYIEFGLLGLENISRRPNNIRKSIWSKSEEYKIYHLRKKFPLWGKAKITVEYYQTYGLKISESTVGRILSKLLKKNKIVPVRFLYGKKDTKRRIFNGHAKRWKLGMKATKPGELIQVDHMTITVPGIGILKHFNAVCPITKFAVYKVYREATSKNAADFLVHMQKEFPFPIISIQTDGGGEFMGEFEQACATSDIPLFVLPPRSPEYNCNVERGNGTAKYEFYTQYDKEPSFHMIQKNLQKFAHFYNFKRPHQGIGLLTPGKFYESIRIEAPVSYVLN